ncbi:VC0807 family protein [Streptomyces sp. NPDC000594]|uniref:VC0807 family protein n=1 Tax=Streptomyces sp. NPDC000594 TaxID=3154261 RepID=UPI00332C9BE7
METPNGRTGTQKPPPWRTVAAPILFTLVLPLAVFHVLRSQGFSQWLALTLSGAVPAVRMAVEAATRRRMNSFEAFMIGMLAVRVATSLLTGSPRVVLVKDAALAAAAGLWILASLRVAKPFAFQAGQYLHGPAAARAREAAWTVSSTLRGGLTRLTALWGCAQLLDCAAGVLVALLLPVEAVPALNRAKGLALLGAVALVSIAYSRRYGRRHALSLFGSPPLIARREGRSP